MTTRFSLSNHARRTAATALLAVIVYVGFVSPLLAQEESQEPKKHKVKELFASDQTLDITIRAPWGDIIRDKTNQNPYPATLEYTDAQGQTHSFPLTVGRRGLTRQTVCKFPPIKLRIEKEAVKGTLFSGQRSLKLVTHCDNGSKWEQYYIKEMLAYKMYNLITDISFRVRPLTATYIDTGNNRADGPHFAFVVEDDSDVAKRNGLKSVDLKKIWPEQIDSVEGSRLALFQYMIANVDWSGLKGPGGQDCCHNARLLGLDPKSTLYVVPYDFDSSGLVDAHYAAPNAGLPLTKVTQRLYRGYCAHNGSLEAARQEFLAKEPAIMGLIENESRLNRRNATVAERYLDTFFDELKSDSKFDRSIVKNCRG